MIAQTRTAPPGTLISKEMIRSSSAFSIIRPESASRAMPPIRT
jgi:hypothetical protein